MDVRDVLAANIRQIRHQKGLTQEELADAASVNRTYMSKLETARTFAGLEIIDRLATALEVEPYQLLMPVKKKAGSKGR